MTDAEVRAAAEAMRQMIGSPTWEEYAAVALAAAERVREEDR